MKGTNQNSSNFKEGDLAYGLFCDRVGIVTSIQEVKDGFQVLEIVMPNGNILVEHECYWIHLAKEERYRQFLERNLKPEKK